MHENATVIFITKKELKKKKTIMLQIMTMETALNFIIPKSIYNDSDIFMVSREGTNSYLNNEQVQIGDIKMMNAAYDSSG